MLTDRTAEELRGRARALRIAAQEAEDTCVKLRLVARARDIERLAGLLTPVFSADDRPTLQ
jgi:hypothetical protein